MKGTDRKELGKMLQQIVKHEDHSDIIYHRYKCKPALLIAIDDCDVQRMINEVKRITVRWDGPKRPAYRIVVLLKNGKREYLPRFLLNPENGLVVDHINHDTLNNRRCNLRVVTNSENIFNRRGAQRLNASGNRNVTYCKRSKSWKVSFKFGDCVIHAGSYGTLEEAKEVAERDREKVVLGSWVKVKRVELKGKQLNALNNRIYQRDSGSCVLCSSRVQQGEKFHHILFKSHGGGDTEENGVTLCMNCHRKAHGPESKSIRQILLDYIKTIYGGAS